VSTTDAGAVGGATPSATDDDRLAELLHETAEHHGRFDPFALPYGSDEITDARQRFDLSRPGRYVAEARIPLMTFTTGDAANVILDCDQFRNRTVVNVGPQAGTGRASSLVLSPSGAHSLRFAERPPVSGSCSSTGSEWASVKLEALPPPMPLSRTISRRNAARVRSRSSRSEFRSASAEAPISERTLPNGLAGERRSWSWASRG